MILGRAAGASGPSQAGGQVESKQLQGQLVEDVTVDDLLRDPYGIYRRLRDAGPCVWMAPAKRYVVPRWADVFSLDENPAMIAAEPDSLMTRAMGLSMLRTDGETHARQRQAAHRVLRVKEFQARWAGMLERVADELLDELAPHGQADLVAAFAEPYAARTLKLLLGLEDVSDRDMQIWSQALINAIGNYADDPEVWRRCEQASVGIDAAIERWWDRAAEGTVLQSMVTAGTVSADEVHANIKLFISGGLNEPRDVIATTAWALLADGEQESLVRDDPDLFPAAVEEALRWMSPIAMYPRYVALDTKLGDVELPPGTRIGVLLASANRDERHWEDPDRFDLRRATQRHIAFSRGPHVCLGAFVARQQIGRSALPRLFARFPRLRLVDGFEARQIGWVFRGLASLDVTWG
jgi:cytochrome P450